MSRLYEEIGYLLCFFGVHNYTPWEFPCCIRCQRCKHE